MSNARNLARLLPNASGQLPPANVQKLLNSNMASGSVIQVVEFTYSGSMSANAVAAAITPISGSITPTLASSKILAQFIATASTSGYQMFGAWVNRNGSQIGVNQNSTSSYKTTVNASMGSGYSAGDAAQSITGWVLDNPATTSPVTYDLVMGTRTGNQNAIRANSSWNYSNGSNEFSLPGTCKLILMEIAA